MGPRSGAGVSSGPPSVALRHRVRRPSRSNPPQKGARSAKVLSQLLKRRLAALPGLRGGHPWHGAEVGRRGELWATLGRLPASGAASVSL